MFDHYPLVARFDSDYDPTHVASCPSPVHVAFRIGVYDEHGMRHAHRACLSCLPEEIPLAVLLARSAMFWPGRVIAGWSGDIADIPTPPMKLRSGPEPDAIFYPDQP